MKGRRCFKGKDVLKGIDKVSEEDAQRRHRDQLELSESRRGQRTGGWREWVEETLMDFGHSG